MHTLPTLLLTALLAAPLAAQGRPVVVDGFDDDMIGTEWTVRMTVGAFIDVSEDAGELRATGSLLTQSRNGAFFLTQDFTPFTGAFQLDVPLRWEADPRFGPLSTSSVAVRLLAGDRSELARLAYDDDSFSDGGRLEFVGPSIGTAFPAQVDVGQAQLRLRRDGTGGLSWSLLQDGDALSGTLGALPAEVAAIEVRFEHEGFGSPPFTTIALDGLRLDTALTPLLAVEELVAGQPATMTVVDATPFQPVKFLYSTTGDGPTQTILGPLSLDDPIGSLPLTTAGPGGTAALPLLVPGGAGGRSIWFQAVDLASQTTTNGVAAIVR
ncbi:MAG: hypothetical protein ACYTF3_00530 [Planctomycetota bacterium]